jgi:hypothetical protein
MEMVWLRRRKVTCKGEPGKKRAHLEMAVMQRHISTKRSIACRVDTRSDGVAG